MTSNPAIREPAAAEERDFKRLLEEAARLCRQDVSPETFYGRLLDQAVAALLARGGAVWLLDPDGNLQVCYQTNLAGAGIEESTTAETSHRRLIRVVLREGEARAAAPRSGPAEDAGAGNPTEHLLLLCPVLLPSPQSRPVSGRTPVTHPAAEPLGVVEIFQRPEVSPAAQSGSLRFLNALCELAAEYHQRRRFREMQDRSSLWGRFQQFSEKLHGSLDLDTTAYVLANEGRSLIGSDRLTVAVRRGSKYRVRAVSGLDTFDRRSNVVRSVERLVRSVARTNEPLWYSGDTAGLPPQIAEPLEQYVVESNARFLAVLPLTPTEPARVEPDRSDAPRFSEDALPLGALVVERFEAGEPDDAFRHRVEAACRQSTLALRNAVEYESIPLLPVLKLCRRLFRFLRLRHLPRTVAAALLVVAVVLALILVPADFEISARGELQPALRRDVFAPTDGVVRAIEVGQGDDVEKNQLLVALRNSELDLQHRRILGEIQTTQKELGTVAVSLRAANPNDPAELAEYNELAARENELTARLASLQEQQRIVQRQIDALQIRSPIDGEVLTWDLAARLEARPVKRGQVLMTVARVEGPWVVELEVADEHVGHVLQARRDLGEDLRVEFLLSADPTRTYAGWIERVSPSTELNEEGEPVVPVTVAFDRQEVGSLRPGASVAGRIQCGRRAIGYVWFHELLEAIQKRLLF